MTQKLVLIGNGHGRRKDARGTALLAPDSYEITVFGAEPHPNYNRIMLSPVLAGEKTIDDIILNSRFEWYAENGYQADQWRSGRGDQPCPATCADAGRWLPAMIAC